MAIKPIDKSYIFNMLNENNAINNIIKEILSKGIKVTQNSIEEQLLTIKKRFKYPLKNQVVEALDKGQITLMMHPEVGNKLPTSLPFFLMQTSNGVGAIVMLDSFGTRIADGGISIDARKLYVLMESAFMAIKYQTQNQKYSNNNNLIHQGAVIYANMFAKPLSRKFNINADKVRMQKMLFLASKFYMVNVIGMNINNIETINNISLKVSKATNMMALDDVINDVELESFSNIMTFVERIANTDLNLGLNSLTLRNYLEAFMQMFGTSSLLSLELFQYFMFNINSAHQSAFMNNQYMFEDLIEGSAEKMYGVFTL